MPHRQQNRAGLGHGREVPERCELQREYPDSSYVPERVQQLRKKGVEDLWLYTGRGKTDGDPLGCRGAGTGFVEISGAVEDHLARAL